MKIRWIVIICASVVHGAASAVIDGNVSHASMPNGPQTLLCCPLGDGHSIPQLIRILAVDAGANPVDNLTAADFEVDGVTPGQVADAYFAGFTPAWDVTPGGTFETGGGGDYYIHGPFYAGGHENNGCFVKVGGVRILSSSSLPLTIVSPDLTGDGAVTLADLPVLATLFFSPQFDMQADLYHDGVENLSDLVVFVQHMGHTFPTGAIEDGD